MKKILGVLAAIAILAAAAFAIWGNQKSSEANDNGSEVHDAEVKDTAQPTQLTTLHDVSNEGEFYDSISWAVENGIMEANDGMFSPEKTATRTDMVSALYQYAKYIGNDVSGGEEINILSYNDATDIAEGKYEAFQWACFVGLIGKESDTSLRPNEELTRQDVIKLLYDFAVLIKQDVSIGEDVNILSYNDFAEIDEGNFEAFQWACGAGIIRETDTASQTLNPMEKETRAQIAEIIMQFDNIRTDSAA